jgi:predicted nucleic-acid-binding Zn-ribbon protein
MTMMVNRDVVAKWLESHAPRMSCSCCGLKNFTVDESVAMTSSLADTKGRINYLAGVPLVSLVCSNCGHVAFFSAKMLGVI